MADRISSDHDSIETHRAPLETVGRTDRVKVVLPPEAVESDGSNADDGSSADDGVANDGADTDGDDLAVGDVVELFLDGEKRYAEVDSTLEGDLVVRRATDNRRQAREGDGENRLAAWVEGADVRVGASVHLDVITPGHAYGLRTPGTQTVYRVSEPPSDALADIAADVDGE